MGLWAADEAGVVRLPSGRLVRGRGLGRPLRDGALPEFGVFLLGKQPQPVPWDARWVRWPDFRLPADRWDAQEALREAWHRAASQRVEVACGGGRGRSGTALACLAVLDGLPTREAVTYVRHHYDPQAVETLWQRRYVTLLPSSVGAVLSRAGWHVALQGMSKDTRGLRTRFRDPAFLGQSTGPRARDHGGARRAEAA